MSTTKVFRSGNIQAAQLPKEFRFKSAEVEIFRRGNDIILREKKRGMVRAFDLLASLPDDLRLDGRQKGLPQTRRAGQKRFTKKRNRDIGPAK